MATPRLGLVVEDKPTELSCKQLCVCERERECMCVRVSVSEESELFLHLIP